MTQIPGICFSQNKKLKIESGSNPLTEKCFQTNKTDTIDHAFLEDCLNCIREKGFLSASIDSLINKQDSVSLYLYTGHQFYWKDIILADSPLNLIPLGLKKTRFLNKKPASYNKVQSLKKKWISAYENNGYPFVSVSTDSFYVDSTRLILSYSIDPGRLVKYDSLEVTGTKKVSAGFLQNYLGIKKGNIYSEKRISTITKRIKELPFVTEKSPAEVYFIEDYAKIRFFLKDKKTNQFNGILGIIPNKNKPGKYILTGDVTLNLNNSFKHGDIIHFSWKKLESSSQNLFLEFQWPYLFKTPIGINTSLKLFKKDSSYVNATTHIGLPIYFIGSNHLGIYYERISSALLSVSSFSSATTLPSVSSFISTMYGLQFLYNAVDYKPNPRSGISIKMQAGYGNKIIEKIPEINPLLYENVVLNSFRNEFSTDLTFYTPLYRKLILKLRAQSGYLNSRKLLENELFRIGGLNSLRGFDEERIYASAFGIGTAEVRFHFEQNSAFFLFYDQSRYLDLNNKKDDPYGFGAGIAFQTASGIFTLSYALGSQQHNPVEFRNARVHFGFINNF